MHSELRGNARINGRGSVDAVRNGANRSVTASELHLMQSVPVRLVSQDRRYTPIAPECPDPWRER